MLFLSGSRDMLFQAMDDDEGNSHTAYYVYTPPVNGSSTTVSYDAVQLSSRYCIPLSYSLACGYVMSRRSPQAFLGFSEWRYTRIHSQTLSCNHFRNMG